MLPASLAVLLLAATLTGHAPEAPPAADTARPAAVTQISDRARERTPASVLRGMSLPQRVGQLFMVGTPADEVDRTTRSQIGRFHVGNVMLTGRSYGGVRPPARVSRAMRSEVSTASTSGVRLFVATDQEGGLVRVLQGSGFSEIPSALVQGSWSLKALRSGAKTWAGELHRAGVNLNLAPVMDTVPSRRAATHNPPIGKYDREFGFRTTVVARHGVAFLRGMRAGGVETTAKHFPGLGRVRGNTDTSAGVTDRVTRRHDPYLRPFQAAISADVPFMMMSTAFYSRLDPNHPAAFSPFVIRTMLRGDLGFDGVVISDDLARARQVASFSPAQRALRFIGAGGDVVLVVDPEPLPAMYRAVLRRAQDGAAFRAKVDAAALRVLRAKGARELLGR